MLNGSLWIKYKAENDYQAREAIIHEYSRLAKYVVDRMNVYPSAAISYDDMLSYAIIGLIDAVEKFDPAKGIKFETYASTRIRGSVLDAIKSLDWVPRSVRSAEQNLRRVMANLEAVLGRLPSDEEIAREIGIGVDELGDLFSRVGQSAMLSLEELMSSGVEGTVLETATTGNAADDPVCALEIGERKRILARSIDELPERERLAIMLYYMESLTLKEIAQVMGVTESRVCQIHSKAILRLHGKLQRHTVLMA